MNGTMRFVDTNILLYAACDVPRETDKRRRALGLLAEPDLALSVQVLQEFYHQATRRSRQGRLTPEQALIFLVPLRFFPIQQLTPAIFDRAVAISRRFRISYWDGAILAAARSLGCDAVYSEDLSSEQDYGGLRVIKSLSGRAGSAMTTDTTEKGLESLICASMTSTADDLVQDGRVRERPSNYGAGWIQGDPQDYDREYCVDLAQLSAFLQATQPKAAESLDLGQDSPTRRKFLARLQGETTKRGTIDVLRNGVRHGPHHIDLMYGTPSPENEKAKGLYGRNRFSVTRQLRYSRDQTQLALDLCLFINGLPVATFELKNSLTKQTVEDAVEQYKRDRNPREKLFEIGRCLAHFAVDDHEVKFCTHLQGKASWFLPFNRGWDDGAGNEPNPNGLKTDYLWKQVLTRGGLTDIIENYAQLLETRDDKTGHRKRQQIWPRYHQLDVVRRLLEDVSSQGVGRRYLIQHSAGSGKSNSIAWLAHQLTGLERDNEVVFDTVLIVTDRRLLDQQIRDTIRQFAQVGSIVGHAEDSGHLRRLLQEGKRIIITTVQKFPFILDAIGNEHRGRKFAMIIDEAHSSQGGRTSASVSMALGEAGAEEEDETTEDKINRLMESKKLLPNASYFAFTATPKNKTLEIFGTPVPEGGNTKHVPFHSYTMKQAIQEGFIVDVLAHYTPVNSYYRLVKTVEGDPEFDTKRAGKKLRRYVEDNDHAIRLKAEIMVDNFHDKVVDLRKIGGEARAMVVTSSIRRAISYYCAIRDYLAVRKSPYQAIVAFSGEHEFNGTKLTEASLNGFSSNLIADRIQEDPYRFLVCADKFQTGYDEPLLHTMYVDKALSGVKAVQTLSRLNRAHPKKHDAFVLDFSNDADTIQAAFSDYYRTTVLAEETDPDRLHDLKADLDGCQVYSPAQVDELVETGTFPTGRSRPTRPDPGRLRLGLPGAVGRGRSGRLQGKGEGVPPGLRVPGNHPALHLRRVGEALHLPDFPGSKAARARRGRSVEGDSRGHRHGQLPCGEAGGAGHPASRRGRGDRAGTHRGRRAEAGIGDGPALQNHQCTSMTGSATSIGRTRTR